MNQTLLYQWTEEIARELPSLNSWQVANVGLFSLGIIEAESCQQEQVARRVSCGEQVRSAARRWRRFLANKAFPLRTFFAEWTGWVLKRLAAEQVYLVVDETKIQDRIGVMLVGLVWEGRSIPLAWRCYPANSRQGYPSEGQVAMIVDLLEAIQPGIPAHCQVTIMADRGIGTSPTLCQAVADLGWYYLFRVTRQSKICTAQGALTIAAMVKPGEAWQAQGQIFKQRGRVPAHARAIWSLGYAEPWALVTNHAALTGFEYACRNWIEQGFRDLKSYGWQWQRSAIRQPDHMQRLLVLLTLAYTWMLALGSVAVATRRTHPLTRSATGSARRHWSLFKEGLQFFVEYLSRYSRCLTLTFLPDTRFT